MSYREEIDVSAVVYKKLCDQTRICHAVIFIYMYLRD